MKHYYAVYDRLAESYGTLNEMINDNVAIRAFREACTNVDGYKHHARDLELHRIGHFNEETGSFKENKEILEKGATMYEHIQNSMEQR